MTSIGTTERYRHIETDRKRKLGFYFSVDSYIFKIFIEQVERNYPLCLMDNVCCNWVGIVIGHDSCACAGYSVGISP